jgi:hypothetical protein
MNKERPFTETRENKRALARLVKERWANIVKAIKALGLPIPKEPK